MPLKDKEARKKYQLEYYKKNKTKILLKVKEWGKAHPDRRKKLSRESARRRVGLDPVKARHRRIKYKYGLSPLPYLFIYMGQFGKCGICEVDIDPLTCHVDHSHETGKVRGLLCSKCNPFLGIHEKWYEKYKLKIEEYLTKTQRLV